MGGLVGTFFLFFSCAPCQVDAVFESNNSKITPLYSQR